MCRSNTRARTRKIEASTAELLQNTVIKMRIAKSAWMNNNK